MPKLNAGFYQFEFRGIPFTVKLKSNGKWITSTSINDEHTTKRAAKDAAWRNINKFLLDELNQVPAPRVGTQRSPFAPGS